MTDDTQIQIQKAQGENLARLRKKSGLSAQQLADKMTEAGVKISRGAISNWECGNNGIVLSKLPTLVAALGCNELDILQTRFTNTQNKQNDDAINDADAHNHPIHSDKEQSTMADINTNRLTKSKKLQNVCYDIRGPLLKTAMQMEADGHKIIKLNVGNPAPFGFSAPQEIISDLSQNLAKSVGYSDSKGIFSARKAVLHYHQSLGLKDAKDVNDVYLGNGVSELIVMTMQALLNDGDEVLLPMPDYPLWTAATNLAGGNAVHYLCDEEDAWQPSIEDIKSKITAKTKAIVVINPNNPTGAVYSKERLLEIVAVAREHNLVLLADEIYDRVLYDGAVHTPLALLADDLLTITYNGLSKSHRIAGYRAGWMLLTGKKDHASDFIEGLDMLASMRLCANVPAQQTIQTALGGYQSIKDLTKEGGRLHEQKKIAVQRLNNIPGVSCVEPAGAMYCFPKLDPEVYPIEDDAAFMMDFLTEQKVLVVQGTGFNWHKPDHFRLVFLPRVSELNDALDRLEIFLAGKRA